MFLRCDFGFLVIASQFPGLVASWKMRSYLRFSFDLLRILLSGRHDCRVCSVGSDVDNEENANVLVDGVEVAHVAYETFVVDVRGL